MTQNAEESEEYDVIDENDENAALNRPVERIIRTNSPSSLAIREGSTKSIQKWRVRWTAELHACFKKAVLKYGIKSAQPRVIQAELEAMGVTNITRTSVASHLQKFRQQAVLLNSLSSTSQLTDAHGAVFPDYVAVTPAVTIKPRNPAPDAAAIRARVLSCVRDPVPTVRDPDRVLGGGFRGCGGPDSKMCYYGGLHGVCRQSMGVYMHRSRLALARGS
ncbi:transcription factor PCL1 [Carpediemonas membranifera]|uniref:Transcription factor PCL1 n=1 Tax=Carpediemonas membranifera TaxID=201153 RepID=A0A8J6E3A3_9EUKA|nr:transcription factor PCL1 [Carpediemonas membranifera]|eukprot:KAG9395678.1 transcription factor PCL1 [Carpediemonas membranifera]